MDNPFSASFFSGNRRALFERVGAKLIVVPANCTLQRSGDTTFPFRQDSSFWYLTGVNDPDCTLVITDSGSYVIAPTRSKVQTIFDGAINLNTIKKQSGVDEVLPYREGWTKLKRQLKSGIRVGFPLPSTQLARSHSFALNPSRRLVMQKLRRIRSDIELIDIRLPLATARSIKQPEELVALQQAIDVTTKTFKEVFVSGWYKHYQFEFEVEAALTAGFRKRGASDHAYSPIVAVDKNATTLHYVENQSELSRRGLLLVDAGAEVNGYAADITRVIPVGAKYTARQKQVVEAVADVQKHAMSLLKPGMLMREYEQAVEEYMGQTLQNLGLIKCLTRKNIRKFYPHATSHMLGLDVHDAADYSQPMAENMVLTVEPGIYIPSEKIGVRLEDNVCLTKTGAKVLSAGLPLDLSMGYNKK
jgi:Xaa-Pro aminopeptidase